MASTLTEVAGETKDKVIIGLVMVNDGKLVKAFGIRSIPAVFLVRNGEVVTSFVGSKPKAEVYRILKENGV
jgi:thioredoxin-like negative regulator of GroEL